MRKILALFLFSFIYFSFSPSAFAEKINSFDVDIIANEDGKMDVTENIVYDFENLDRHGIFRDISLYSKVGELYRIINIENVKVERDGKKEKFQKTKTDQQISFKIGDADKTITGEHAYKISYTVENSIGSNFPEFDEIYWNATGNDWTVPIDKASINISTANGIKPNSIACFTRSGNFNAQFCNNISGTSGPVVTTNTMNPGEGLTVVYVYPKGTFPPSILSIEPPKSYVEKVGEFILKHIFLIYFFFNIIIPALLIIWYQKRKNKKRFGKPSVSFEIPKDSNGERIHPALAGTIDNARLERDDVIATIFDLAIRKYIRLKEEKTKKSLRPDSNDQIITKLNEDDGKLNGFEKKLFHRLFKSGDSVKATELRKDFYKTYQELEKEAFRDLVDKKYFIKNPKAQRAFLIVLGISVLFFGNIILTATLFFLSYKLIGRTSLGDEIDYKIDGLKLFLKSMDRNYKWQAEKFYTVEQMIPYAVSLGFIDKFMEQLKIINPDYNPKWYSGYHGSFYASYGAFYSSVNSNVTTSAPSSSSGSSGGFSGGGGGGGGGGSW